MTRAKKVQRAQQLRDRGLSVTAIAETMGVARSTASAYLCDPDFAKQRIRRERYSVPCPECGQPMDGSGGLANIPPLCASCSIDARTFWTQERIIEAIQAFARQNGRPPVSDEWRGADRPEGVPVVTWVQRRFGSWANGIEAAGFPRPLSGQYQIASRGRKAA